MTALDKLKADFKGAVAGSVLPNVGDKMLWAGGTLTRTAPGVLRYQDTTNGYYQEDFNATTDPLGVAKRDGAVNALWILQYGINLRADPAQYKEQASRLTFIANYGVRPGTVFPLGIPEFPPITVQGDASGALTWNTPVGPMNTDRFMQSNYAKAICGTA